MSSETCLIWPWVGRTLEPRQFLAFLYLSSNREHLLGALGQTIFNKLTEPLSHFPPVIIGIRHTRMPCVSLDDSNARFVGRALVSDKGIWPVNGVGSLLFPDEPGLVLAIAMDVGVRFTSRQSDRSSQPIDKGNLLEGDGLCTGNARPVARCDFRDDQLGPNSNVLSSSAVITVMVSRLLQEC